MKKRILPRYCRRCPDDRQQRRWYVVKRKDGVADLAIVWLCVRCFRIREREDGE